MKILFLKGGAGSGFKGHKGREGKRGGSAAAMAEVVQGTRAALVGSNKIELSRSAVAYAKQHFRTTGGRFSVPLTVTRVDGRAIALGVALVKHGITTTPNVEAIYAVPFLPALLTNAVYLGAAPETKGRSDIKQWHYYGAVLSLDGDKHLVQIDVKETLAGELAYHHAVVEPGRLPGSTAEADGVGWSVNSPRPLRESAFTVATVRQLFKRDRMEKALGPGERWITVKPPGHDKGQPLLIRDMPDGSSKVIAGAGGSVHMVMRETKGGTLYYEHSVVTPESPPGSTARADVGQ